MTTNHFPFIVMTGPVGGGKTTHIERLEGYLKRHFPTIPLLSTKASRNGNAFCMGVHRALADARKERGLVPVAELFGLLAICGEHVARVLNPALAEGKLVIQNRHIYDTYAHLCAAREVIDARDFRYYADRAMQGIQVPDIIFYLDVDPEVGLTRKVKSGETKKVEKEDLDHNVALRRGYEEFFTRWPEHRIIRIDSTRQRVDRTFRQIKEVVCEHLRECCDLKPRP